MFWYIEGALATILLITGVAFQVGKSLKRGTTGDLSLPMIALVIASDLCWLVYAVHLKDIFIIISNSFLLSLTLVLLILKLRGDHEGNHLEGPRGALRVHPQRDTRRELPSNKL